MFTRITKILVIFLICFMFAGCFILHNGSDNKKISYHYPADIQTLCIQAREDAKVRIEQCGTPLTVKVGQTVKKRQGEKKFGDMWAWYDSRWKFYVGGLTSGSDGNVIEVGCNPVTGGEIHYGALVHENGHYWLISNYRDAFHNQKYDPAFQWSGLGVRFVKEDNTNVLSREMIGSNGLNVIVLDANNNFKENYYVVGY